MHGLPLAVQDRYVSWSHLPDPPAPRRKVSGMGVEEVGGQPTFLCDLFFSLKNKGNMVAGCLESCCSLNLNNVYSALRGDIQQTAFSACRSCPSYQAPIQMFIELSEHREENKLIVTGRRLVKSFLEVLYSH